MKICTQCTSPTNRPVKVRGEIICQECAGKIIPKIREETEEDYIDRFNNNWI
ncbi:MAG: hypothetical protein KKD77_21980 [Gammaproteobacteria bacterium]|nr:hypothetical protein [Gammaproteobacteria bacterium]MBU2249432.1 hypothetical protein [Gammaproteobacteria bacterium]MBU2685612.1 hypothetical protein [Gammaproteobacteria bacterium]